MSLDPYKNIAVDFEIGSVFMYTMKYFYVYSGTVV